MCFGDAVLTEMEDGGRKHGTRMALNHSVDQVLQRTHAAAGNHGNGNAVSNGPGQCKIIALPRAVAIHRSEEHTSELQSLMRISYAVFCLKKKTDKKHN